MATESLVALGLFILVNFAAATTGARFRPGPWYEGLAKPAWTPPDWAFPVVWTTLYAANAVSGWLVWEAAGPGAWPALTVYALSLGLNAAWSVLFFGLHRLDWAMAEVLLFWASIALVIVVFWPISTLAALLLVPYLVWVSLASALNWRLLRLNGGRGERAPAGPQS